MHSVCCAVLCCAVLGPRPVMLAAGGRWPVDTPAIKISLPRWHNKHANKLLPNPYIYSLFSEQTVSCQILQWRRPQLPGIIDLLASALRFLHQCYRICSWIFFFVKFRPFQRRPELLFACRNCSEVIFFFNSNSVKFPCCEFWWFRRQ
jgi:hypothetical protein